MQPTTQEQPLLTQMAYDAKTRSLFVLTAYALARVAVGDCKTAHVVWQARMPVATLHGSPTVAGSTVWITAGGSPSSFRGYDTKTGRLRFKAPAGVLAFVPPAIVGGRVFARGPARLCSGETATVESAGRRRAPDRVHELERLEARLAVPRARRLRNG